MTQQETKEPIRLVLTRNDDGLVTVADQDGRPVAMPDDCAQMLGMGESPIREVCDKLYDAMQLLDGHEARDGVEDARNQLVRMFGNRRT